MAKLKIVKDSNSGRFFPTIKGRIAFALTDGELGTGFHDYSVITDHVLDVDKDVVREEGRSGELYNEQCYLRERLFNSGYIYFNGVIFERPLVRLWGTLFLSCISVACVYSLELPSAGYGWALALSMISSSWIRGSVVGSFARNYRDRLRKVRKQLYGRWGVIQYSLPSNFEASVIATLKNYDGKGEFRQCFDPVSGEQWTIDGTDQRTKFYLQVCYNLRLSPNHFVIWLSSPGNRDTVVEFAWKVDELPFSQIRTALLFGIQKARTAA